MHIIKDKYTSWATRSSIILLLMLGYTVQLRAQSNTTIEQATEERADTAEVEDNPYAIKKDGSILPVDSARLRGDLDYVVYLMDDRYLPVGDSIKKRKWYKNLFLEMGLGMEKLVPPSDGLEFHPMTTFHVGLGWQVNRNHAFRLIAKGVNGYRDKMNTRYLRAYGAVDHLFDLSTYLHGYNPARKLGMGTVFGLGAGVSHFQHSGYYHKVLDIHGGLQFKFYTGPHGIINVEPYVMLTNDGIDYTENHSNSSKPRNYDAGGKSWRRFDIAYGVNVNAVYYFENHLERMTRKREISKLRAADKDLLMPKDSLNLYSWQRPWIFEVSAGHAFNKWSRLALYESMDHELAISVGKWFSPVIGVRGTVLTRHTNTLKTTVKYSGGSYDKVTSDFYVGGRVEAMVNPLGFMKSFRWDAPYGFYIMAGTGLGRQREYVPRRTFTCESYTAGLHLFARMSEGLQIFVEPRINHNVYNFVDKNKVTANNTSDRAYSVNFGVTALNLEKPYRKYAEDYSGDMKRFIVGVDGGINMISTGTHVSGNKKLNYNFSAFAQYRLSTLSSVRLSFQHLTHHTNTYNGYVDRDMSLPNLNYAPKYRYGIWNNTNNMGMIALDYSFNLSNFFGGYRDVGPSDRFLNLEIFGGPALVMQFSQNAEIDSKEKVAANHEVESRLAKAKGTTVAINGGLKLSIHVAPQVAITLTPQIYYAPKLKVPTLDLGQLRFLETLNLGVQYHF